MGTCSEGRADGWVDPDVRRPETRAGAWPRSCRPLRQWGSIGSTARQAPRASKRADSWLRQDSARIEDLGVRREWAPSAYGSGVITFSPRRGTSDQPA
eukprot:6214763-Pleurochrysis_carterae.AAC.6